MWSAQIPPYGLIQSLQEEQPEGDGAYWINELQHDDGLFLHVRHTAREDSIDIQGFDLYESLNNSRDFSACTCLNAEGKSQAQLLGWAVGQVIAEPYVVASPSCRARETALIAFGHVDEVDSAHLHLSAIPESQRDGVKLSQKDFFNNLSPEVPGTMVIVGHNSTAYSGNDMVNHRDGRIPRKQGGISVASWDPEHQTFVIHFTWESLTDFVMSVF